MSASAFNDLSAERRPRPALVQFTLETLLLVVTLVAAGLGLLVAVPPLGAWLVIIGGLALVRTIVECRRFLRDGRPLLMADKLGSFFGSLGYTFLAVVYSLLVLGALSVVALAFAAFVAWMFEIADHSIASEWAVAIIGLVATFLILAVMVNAFHSVYWQTILPRTTLDPTMPGPSVAENVDESAR